MPLSFNDLWSQLDLDKVITAIGNLPRGFDTDAARECVYYAAHRWLVRDYETIILDAIEEKKTIHNFKYVMDIRGRFNGNGSVKLQEGRSVRVRPFGPLKGKKLIIDWKTSKNTLDQNWVQRYHDSWQWRTYLFAEQADVFIYRGIRRRNYVNGDLETKEVIIHRSEDPRLDEIAANQINLMKAQRDNLIQLGATPWPMNRPNACYKYGYQCKYIDDCWAGTFPVGDLDISHPVSYSRMEEFLLCPERFRRNAIARVKVEAEEEESESAAFGNSVHRGLAEIYKQTFKL